MTKFLLLVASILLPVFVIWLIAFILANICDWVKKLANKSAAKAKLTPIKATHLYLTLRENDAVDVKEYPALFDAIHSLGTQQVFIRNTELLKARGKTSGNRYHIAGGVNALIDDLLTHAPLKDEAIRAELKDIKETNSLNRTHQSIQTSLRRQLRSMSSTRKVTRVTSLDGVEYEIEMMGRDEDPNSRRLRYLKERYID